MCSCATLLQFFVVCYSLIFLSIFSKFTTLLQNKCKMSDIRRRKVNRKVYFANRYKKIKESKIVVKKIAMTSTERSRKCRQRKRETSVHDFKTPIIMHSDQLEVLNISNVNESGQIVLNDEKLLELIQKYPFLYNPNLSPFQNPDYDEWAWMNIASDLNKIYAKQVRVEPFPVPVLINRWQLLRPLIVSLSKSHDINAIPSVLRQHVINLSQHHSVVKPEPFDSSQNRIIENNKMVERLPLVFRDNLEVEAMSHIVKTELESEDTETTNDINVEPSINNLPMLNEVKLESSNYQLFEYEEKHQLSMPLKHPQWVPTEQANLYIQNCVVRLKRLSLTPNNIPVTHIKMESIW